MTSNSMTINKRTMRGEERSRVLLDQIEFLLVVTGLLVMIGED